MVETSTPDPRNGTNVEVQLLHVGDQASTFCGSARDRQAARTAARDVEARRALEAERAAIRAEIEAEVAARGGKAGEARMVAAQAAAAHVLDELLTLHGTQRQKAVVAYLSGLRGGLAVQRLAARMLACDLAALGITLPLKFAVWESGDVPRGSNGISGAFDGTVPLDSDSEEQAAGDACPPGMHDGPLVLPADRELHIFGCG